MIGAVLVVVVTVVVIPVILLIGGAITASILGSTMTIVKERDHEGSELVELNV